MFLQFLLYSKVTQSHSPLCCTVGPHCPSIPNVTVCRISKTQVHTEKKKTITFKYLSPPHPTFHKDGQESHHSQNVFLLDFQNSSHHVHEGSASCVGALGKETGSERVTETEIWHSSGTRGRPSPPHPNVRMSAGSGMNRGGEATEIPVTSDHDECLHVFL